MKPTYNLGWATLVLALPLALSSCSKQQDASPASTVSPPVSADVRVVNGRVVFTTQQAFEQTQSALRQIGTQANSAQQFDAWERNLHFTSLRTAANEESYHLEELDIKGAPAPAYQLQDSFGFPAFYATYINPAGEYQVGDKIYWFHEGARYEASSQVELAAIKQNPTSAKRKFAAGSRSIQSGVLPKQGTKGPATTNTTVATDNPYSDFKYHTEFSYPTDAKSIRRIIYDVRVYAADNGTDPGNYARYFYTSIILQLKLEYYSQSTGKWYPAKETFFYQYNCNFSGIASVADQLGTSSTKTASLSRSFSTGDGLYAITMADDNVTSNVGTVNHNTGEVKWTFDITGSISGYAKAAPGNVYTVNTNPLW